ncbi:alcohol oxidase-like protein [Rhexocercosporidium sp. MPI-PUGE-AT-0058]|nr:alcohol oxidase-like protein [Rhexocercosporidium sp. MPI-PUGE-AT-0058]
MGIYNQLPIGLDEVDIIIAGGGTAGCIVAARLAAADPSLSILVVEAGQNNFNNPTIVHPGVFFLNVLPVSTTATFWQGEKSEHLAGRSPIVLSGGILGGGSSINFMMYTRAQACDFNSWKTPGWTAKDLLPYLKKICFSLALETYHGAGYLDTHGSEGPVHISNGGFRVKRSEEDFIVAASKVGFPEIVDLQDLESNNGVSRWLRYVSPEGKRQDTAHTYLHPLINDGKHQNIHVLVENQVVRVLFDEQKIANGVEISLNLLYHPVTATKVVKARKLVVVSAGACGTPLVLERSGVGDFKVLQKASVPVVANIPGVGHDYQDHTGVFPAYKTDLKLHETNNALLRGLQTLDEAIKQVSPNVRWNTVDVAAKIRPDEQEVAALGREFQTAWEKDFKKELSKPLGLLALIGEFFVDRSLYTDAEFISIASYNAYPYSRGSIHITGPRISDPPKFDTGYLSDENDFDLKAHIWQYKKQREIMRRTNMYRGELASAHPKFSSQSNAACLDLDVDQGMTVTEDIVYSAEDDKAIEQYLRENLTTTWHSLGTAKMAPRQEMGVVDRFLNVYGVQGLKVIDLSIVPENVGANTNNTALVVGEKGADIIATELGLPNL